MKLRPALLSLRIAYCILLLALLSVPCAAHIGSPDIYAEGDAGPYKLFVTVRLPVVIPGVADVEVRTSDAAINQIQAAPMPLQGEGAEHPPVPDTMQRSAQDPQFYTAHLWLMASGSWQIRFVVDGKQGKHALSIPVAAVALTTKKMDPLMGIGLSMLGMFLLVGAVGIVGAAVREAKLKAGEQVPDSRRNASIRAMTGAFVIVTSILLLGGMWWSSEAASYREHVYRPLAMQANIDADNSLSLQLSAPERFAVGDSGFIPDHGHLMHLYAVREPGMDVVYHLHPEQISSEQFGLQLPSMPAGNYRLYADVVHTSGFPETLVATAAFPVVTGRTLSGDDASATTSSTDHADTSANTFTLPDGYTMIWERPQTLKARTAELFRFHLVDAKGNPPADMALYMGMLGHAAFLKTDGSVFAHVHPSGTTPMAAQMIADQQTQKAFGHDADVPMNNMQMPEMQASPLPNAVSFPYGFPSGGRYRIFVQMKHGATIETGIFDALVLE